MFPEGFGGHAPLFACAYKPNEARVGPLHPQFDRLGFITAATGPAAKAHTRPRDD